MKLIVNLKLKPLESQFGALCATLERANEAANWISEQAFQNKIFKQFNLHKLVYHSAKDKFSLTAQMVVRVIAKVADSYKIQTTKQTTFRKHGSIAYDDRIIRFKPNDSVNLWTVEGRQTIPFQCGEHQRKLLPYLKGEVDLIYRKGDFYLNAVCDIEEPEKLGFSDIIGVDFGVVNIITDSKGEAASGASVEQVRQKYSSLRQTLQYKASRQSKDGKRPRSIRRFQKKLSKRESGFRKHTNHVISNQLVEKAKAQDSALALENLKGIRKRIETRFRANQRAKISGWSFAQLREYIAYKSKMHGVQLFLIDPRNTSRECSECGHIAKENRKGQSEFVCISCNTKLNNVVRV